MITVGDEASRLNAGEIERSFDGSKRSILIIAINYAPDDIGCAKYTTELAESLVERGWSVRVVAAPPYYPQWRIPAPYRHRGWMVETIRGVDVFRAPIYVPKRPAGFRRVAHLLSFGRSAKRAISRACANFRPDVVFCVAPALTGAPPALRIANKTGALSWLHVQDFEVDAAFGLGLLANPLIRAAAQQFERSLVTRFDQVSTISPAMCDLLRTKGVAPERVFEFRNWVEVARHPWPSSSATRLRAELGIAPEEMVALYSGAMSAKQGLETLAELARAAQAKAPSVRFVFCGEGPWRAPFQASCAGLANVKFLDLQPLERLPELLATADIHLLPQRAEAADLVLPSKLTGMLASGRPVLAMAHPGTGLAAEVEGAGLIVPPGDPGTALTALATLTAEPDLRTRCAAAARARAEQRWAREAIIEGFVRRVGAVTPSI